MLNRPILSHDFIARMRVALRCGDTDPLDRMAAKCADLRDLCATMGEDMMSQGVSMAPYLSDLQALMAMPAHSSIGDLLDAVEEMIEAAIERHEATYHAAGPVGPSDDERAANAPSSVSVPSTPCRLAAATSSMTTLTEPAIASGRSSSTRARASAPRAPT